MEKSIWQKALFRAGTGLMTAALYAGPRLQPLKLLDLTGGFCPPLYPLKQQAILVLWHEHIWIPLGLRFNSPTTLLVSQHRDANWLNDSAENLGYKIIRGSSTRGGSEAIRKLKEISKTDTIVITPDGPTGPRREFSMGAAYLASTLNLPIIPIGVGFDRPWELNTWDKFKIPVPGRQARVVFGPPIHIPRKSRKPALECYSQQIGEHLIKLCDFCKGWARRNDSYEGQYRHGITKTWVKQKIALSDYPVPDFNLELEPPGKQTAQGPLKLPAAA